MESWDTTSGRAPKNDVSFLGFWFLFLSKSKPSLKAGVCEFRKKRREKEKGGLWVNLELISKSGFFGIIQKIKNPIRARLFHGSSSTSWHFQTIINRITNGFKTYGPPLHLSGTSTPTCEVEKVALKTIRRHHDGCHDTVSERYRRRSGWKRHNTTGNTSWSEARQGGSGRPRRRCFRGSTRASKTRRSHCQNGVD